jgi:integrase
VNLLLDDISDEHGARQADYVLAILRKMFNWYASRHDDFMSPVVKGMGRYRPRDRQRQRILDDDEIRALFKAADEAGTFGAILKVLLLTGQRRDKVVSMKWDGVVKPPQRARKAIPQSTRPSSCA